MKKEVKTSIDGLEPGMFVSRLDRPWVKTPFPLQGVLIKSEEDIDRLRKYCSYVYVDVEQGSSPAARYWILSDSPVRTTLFGEEPDPAFEEARRRAREEYSSLRKTTYRTVETLSIETETARKVSGTVTRGYKELVHDLERGRKINLGVVKAGIADMVESINRNPAAMMWIVQMKKLDEYTYSRALGTSVWCATFGRHLGLEVASINQLALGGLLLDLGKSRLPEELLNKIGDLTPEELLKVHQHVDQSVRILASDNEQSSGKKFDLDVLQMVATHHERFDGSGYPQGMTNDDIPIFGRIAGIVDSYDAMTSERPYRQTRPLSPHEAIAELYELRDSKFQAELVEQFIQTVGLYPTGSLVELNSGQVGTVVEINGLRRLQPIVMLLLDENKEPYPEFKKLDLSSRDSLRVERGLEPGAYGINMQELFL
ncbi:MAG: DUF3391 domain-containing protein [Sedimenticola sp.]|nr:DUF3391 domain-containing protein [Sedimenticola sp.]